MNCNRKCGKKLNNLLTFSFGNTVTESPKAIPKEQYIYEENIVDATPIETWKDAVKHLGLKFYYEVDPLTGYTSTLASCVLPVDLGADEYIGLLVSGVAYCSPCDNFNKEHGRTLAFTRMLDNLVKGCVMPIIEGEDNYESLNQIGFFISNIGNDNLPLAISNHLEGIRTTFNMIHELMGRRLSDCDRDLLKSICSDL